ncbi:hypothetical protein ACFX13_030215 [Malus domestica]
MSGMISLSVNISNILFASLTKPSLQRVSIKTLKIHGQIYVVPRPSDFVQHLAPSVGNDTKNHVLKWEDVEVREPNEGEIRVKKKAIMINFTDVYYRKGFYKAATLPYTLGVEACGVVIAVGPDLMGKQVGDLVTYAGYDNSVSTSSMFQVSGGNASLSPHTSSVIPTQDELKKIAAYKAVGFVESDMVIDLGTGSTTTEVESQAPSSGSRKHEPNTTLFAIKDFASLSSALLILPIPREGLGFSAQPEGFRKWLPRKSTPSLLENLCHHPRDPLKQTDR